MRLSVYHKTEYNYTEAVSNSSNELRLTPKQTCQQNVESSIIYVLPASRLWSYHDLNHNHVHHFTVPQPHRQLSIESRSTVITKSPSGYQCPALWIPAS